MKKLVASFLALSACHSVALAQQCAAPQYAAPSCNVPHCAGRTESATANRESGVAQPEGSYIRGPESGEFESGSSSFGLKGFGIKLPAISFEGPEMRLPHLTRYRRNPAMVVESSRAPFVKGRAAEFSQVPRDVPESGQQQQPKRESDSAPVPYQCIPPGPVPTNASTERRLREELARKEAEIREMQDRFGQLENVVNRLAESQQQTREAGYRPRRVVPQPKIVEAGFYEEEADDLEEVVEPPVRRAAPRTTRVAEVPAASPSRTAPTLRRAAAAPREIEQPTPPNVGFSYIPDDEEAAPVDDDGLGVWKGDVRRPVAKPVNGSAKRSSR